LEVFKPKTVGRIVSERAAFNQLSKYWSFFVHKINCGSTVSVACPFESTRNLEGQDYEPSTIPRRSLLLKIVRN
jgi:hypothetical protein